MVSARRASNRVRAGFDQTASSKLPPGPESEASGASPRWSNKRPRKEVDLRKRHRSSSKLPTGL